MTHPGVAIADWSWRNFAVRIVVLASLAIGPTIAGVGPPEADAHGPGMAPESLIDEAIRRLAKLDSITADIDQSLAMLNESFTFKGTFRKAPGHRVLLRLTAGGASGSTITTLQLCDGATLWDYSESVDGKIVKKLSIAPIFKRLDSPDLDGKSRDLIIREIGFAGPEALLIELRTLYKFDIPDATTGVVDGKIVWVLHGTWKKGPGSQELDPQAPRDPGFLPPCMPRAATLYLGKKDHWPYKLELAGQDRKVPFDNRRRGLNGEPIGSLSSIEKVTRTLVVLTYSNVRFNESVPSKKLDAPELTGLVAEDRTGPMVEKLDAAIHAEAERKKAEAEREAKILQGPAIEIDIPSPLDGPRVH